MTPRNGFLRTDGAILTNRDFSLVWVCAKLPLRAVATRLIDILDITCPLKGRFELTIKNSNAVPMVA